MMVARSLGFWMTVTALGLVVAHWALDDVRWSGAFDDLVVAGASAALAGCAAWAWCVTTVVVVEVVAGGRRRSTTAIGVPAWARGAVLTACGAAVLLGPQPAYAAEGIGGLPLPDRPTGASRATPGSTPGGSLPGVTGHGHVHVVRPGDSLWAIAAAHLGHTAPDALVARATTALHHRNRDVVGADPDVVHPGQRLRLPPGRAERAEETR